MSVSTFTISQASDLNASSSSSSSYTDIEQDGFVKIRNGIFYTFYHLRMTRSLYKLSFIIAIVELLQLFTLSFTNFLNNWGDASDSMSWISIIRTFGAGHLQYVAHVVIFWIIVVYLALTWLLILSVYQSVSKEEIGSRKQAILQILIHIVPVIYLPSLSYMFSLMNCDVHTDFLVEFPEENISCWDTDQLVFTIFAIPASVSMIILGGLCSVLYVE
jgi:hypothetical protein